MRRAINAISWIGGLVAGALIMMLILLTGIDVFWRNIEGHSVPGIYEYSEVILVAAVFLSLSWAQKVDAHVSIDLVTRALPRKIERGVRMIGILAALVILIWMSLASVQSAWEAWLSGEYRIGLAEVPVWPARVAVAFGMLMLVLQLCLNLIDLISPAQEQ